MIPTRPFRLGAGSLIVPPVVPPEVTSNHVGAHLVQIEPPDALVLRIVGDLSADDVDGILDAFEALAKGPEPACLLIDVSRAGHITPEARQRAGLRQLPPAYGGLVIFGGTFQQKLVAKLATTAGWLLRGRKLGKPMPAVVKTEAEARAWLEGRRRRA